MNIYPPPLCFSVQGLLCYACILLISFFLSFASLFLPRFAHPFINEYNNSLSINQKIVFDLGCSFVDLKCAYGETIDSFYYNGGNFINFQNNNTTSFCFDTDESNSENRICLTLMTHAENFFNNLSEEKSFSDLENALNIKIESNIDDTGEGYDYFNTFKCFYHGKLNIMVFSEKEGKLSSNDLVFASYERE